MPSSSPLPADPAFLPVTMMDSASWNRALTLQERDHLFGTVALPEGFDAALAGRRLESWQTDNRLSDEHLALRLRQESLDEQRFRHLIGSPPPSADDPDWWTDLRRAYAAAPRRELDDFWPRQVAEQADGGFLPVLRPLLDDAWRRLDERLAESDGLDLSVLGPDPHRFHRLWSSFLPTQLLWMASRSLILELYLSRLQAELQAPTPEARFEEFVAARSGPGAVDAFFATYPVLARCLMNRLRQWLDVGAQVARHLADDFAALEETFGPLGELVDLKSGLGDRHQDGRCVLALTFASGTELIYKPRSLALDVHFQELLTWLGEQGVEPKLRTLRILDRPSYGWVEKVRPAPCESRAEVERFYRRQGVYLALLYALEATDFHHENLIAAGEHPVLIDLETLFQPVLADAELQREKLNPVFTTILRSGLLPRRSGGGGDAPCELSGLGATRGQLTPMRELTRVGTDEMSYVDRMIHFKVGDHLPSLNGAEIPLASMAPILEESFAHTYRKLLELRTAIIGPGGRLDRFKDLEVRVVVRATEIYANINYRAYHPDYLQDSLQFERFMDKLWLDAELLEWFPRIIPSERRELMRGDIPRFHCRTDGRDLMADDFRLPDVLPESGLDLTRRRFESLSPQDLERQLALFRLALASTRRLDEGPAEHDAREVTLPAVHSSAASDDYLDAAVKIGERLETLSFKAQDWVSWFHLAPNPDASQSLQPVGYDLYDGLGGIALFFAHLGRITDEARWTDVARRAVSTARRRLDDPETPRYAHLGGYSGLGGLLYTLAHLGALWQEPDLWRDGAGLCDRIQDAVPGDEGLDMIAGSAGCIGGLLSLYRLHGDSRLLDVAVACGDHLLAKAERQAVGTAWRLPRIAERPLTGFAHGTAGMAWALAHLGHASGLDRFSSTARNALAYERSFFSAEDDNWPDLRVDRSENGRPSYFHAWCHGAPGIGLSRLDLLGILDDPRLREETHAAVRSTRALGFGGSQCLCHGDFGNLDLLLEAARAFGDDSLQEDADQLAARILAGLKKHGARSGISSAVELPGLLTGLAGIGYGLLRCADPSVPTVLLMHTPD